MSEKPAPIHWQHRVVSYFEAAPNLGAGGILLLGFLLRLWKASGTFLNGDEAMHFLAANKPSLMEAYRASLNLAHPPLLILFLHVWRRFGTSELFLRLPSVIAGTIFCWIFFRWATRLLGPAPGWVGLLLVSFLPPLIELSAEVRQYPLLLCFLIAAAYALELALERNSGGMMISFFAFLYLAMLTHFSAMLFAGAAGAYSVWRLVSNRSSRRVVAIWIAGQVCVVGLFLVLYQTHISSLRGSPADLHMQALLSKSYFHYGHDYLLAFVFARTFGVFQYTFGQLAVGDVVGVPFLAGVVLLLRGKSAAEGRGPSSRQLGLLIALPFAINCAAAVADLYPYGGTRHSAFLLPFAIAGFSLSVVKLSRQNLATALVVVLTTIAVCQLFGAPHRPYMRREDQRRVNMTLAMDAIRRQVPPGSMIVVDFQSSFLLRFYLCPDATPSGSPASEWRTYSCGGYRMISANPEVNIFSADTFLPRWREIVTTYNVPPGQDVWIFQAGWDIELARQLQEKFPEFHNLEPDSFGRNISLFKLTAPEAMPAI
jgi:Dolichyl-phosphate-mannose-protein mannosyltransferase